MSAETLAHRAPSTEEEPIFVAIDESPSDDVVFAEARPEAPESDVSSGATLIEPARPAWLPARPEPANSPSNGANGSKSTQSRPEGAPATPPPAKPPRRKSRKPTEALIKVAEEAPEELTWQEKAKRWLVGFAAMGYGLSLIIHFVGLIVLSLIFVTPKLLNNQFAITISQDEGVDSRLEEVELGDDPSSGGSDASAPVDQARLEVARTVVGDEMTELEPEFPSDLLNPAAAEQKKGSAGQGGGDGDGRGDGKGLAFAMPGGGKAVTKGRFTAWTVPTDPEPGESYLIIIQIDLPENVKRLPKADLTYSVQGTDSYRQDFPPNPNLRIRGYLPGNGKQVQVRVFVPGAAANVRDKISIKSRILKEEQNLELVF